MNKKMFIICVVLFLISSCKNDESKEEKSLNNILDDIGLEVEKLVQADGTQEQAGNKAAGGGAGAGAAGGGAVAAGAGAGGAGGAGVGGVPGAGGAGVGGVPGAGGAGGAGGADNIKEKIEKLKKKINQANSQNTSIGKYRKYEEEVKKLREELKKGNGNNGNGGNNENSEKELKKLEDSLKTKKDARKKELGDSKKKFEGFKSQVAAATGVTVGHQVQNQRSIGQQAFRYAQQLGLNVDTTKYGNDTSALVKHIIEEAIKKIAEELKE